MKLARLTKIDGSPVYINPTLVLSIETDGKDVLVTMANKAGSNFKVTETAQMAAETVAQALPTSKS
jgi:uncharacterized protein YlzI (FlbEa/FlbD family)